MNDQFFKDEEKNIHNFLNKNSLKKCYQKKILTQKQRTHIIRLKKKIRER